MAPGRFLLSYPNKETVLVLMAEGHIRGDGFTVVVNHWNQFSGGVRHKLKYEVYAILKDLPLFCWMEEAITGIISGFAVPHRASRSSLRWEDITGFDIVFFCEDISSILEMIKVMVGSHILSCYCHQFHHKAGPSFQ